MPRPRKNEKSKDFKGAIKRLFKDMKKWHVLLFTSLILAVVGSILALISPNKLSDITDAITEGIRPDVEKLEVIIKNVESNFSDQNKLSANYNIILNSDEFTIEEKQIFSRALTSENKEDIMSLDEHIMLELLDEFVIDDVTITSKNQKELLDLLSNVNREDKQALLKTFDSLPRDIYNLVKPRINTSLVKDIVIFLIIINVLGAIFEYFEGYLLCTASNNFARSLRTRISNKINVLPLKYFDSHEMGDILSRVTNDVDSVAMNLNQSLSSLVSSITLFLGSLFMMFITNWIMAITAIVATLIGFSLMSLILSKSQKYFNQKQVELGNLNAHIEEIYDGHSIVKVYNGSKKANEEFDELNKKLYDCNRKSQFLSGLMQPIMGFVGNFGYVAICIVGALLTMNDIISFGVIVAFMIYVRMFTSPLSQIAQSMTGLQSCAAASERVFEFLDELEMNDESKLTKHLNKDKVKGNIEFKNVKFGYNEDKTIIKNFSAKVKAGEKIAIVGPTGAGKTTMVNLLMKFYEINGGDILIDGVSIKELTRENIHDLFVMVLQDTWLFDGTVKENIKFNKDNVTEEDIWRACETVGVEHFVKTLPNGINALLNDNDSISSGQKQLITIARGMIEDAPFLILDEATSNVDTRTEELVQIAMDKLTYGKTSFIIAHRLSTIKNADLILVMNDGNIIEQGKHEELMKKKGFYAELYNSQFQK